MVTQEKIIANIGTSWYPHIGEEFNKDYMRNLSRIVVHEMQRYSVFPDPINFFRAFRETPIEDLKVVIVGQDPYHDGSADGLAFSSKKGITPSLQQLYTAFEHYDEDVIIGNRDGTLDYLAKQGVLLLNRVLTVRGKQPKSHRNIGWETFTTTVIQYIASTKKSVVFLLWGRDAQTLSPYISKEKHLVLECEHPVRASYENRLWYHHNCFLHTNMYLEDFNRKQIIW